ncbi:MAG: NADH-quinone oxidoreductase subunit [Alphaproteobacteria bacterium]|nr:NADH-quinone oxidoreductase subunit [Alphaproteobacteria bacterium]
MTTWPILSVVTFLPTVGALLVYFLARGNDEAANRNARWIALWTTVVTLAVSLMLVMRFDATQPDFQFVEKAPWLANAITYHMGVDGISLPMFPLASHDFAPLIFTMSTIAIIYTSLVALMQEDMKKLIAYSSVAHRGFGTMGLFAATTQGVAGGIFQMVSHGIVSGALFLCVGVVYDRMHTREIAAYGGLVNRMPLYAAAFMVFTLANVGLPGTSGFVGEFLTLLGTFKVNIWVASLATFGVILSAAYALWLYRKVIFGKLEKRNLAEITDLDYREIITLAPLVVLTILFGLYPKPLLDMSAAAVAQLLDNYNHALDAVKAAAAVVQ